MLKNGLTALCALLVLTACGSNDHAMAIPVQHWQDMDVRIEPHPNPPVAGISEMVVIITGPRGIPVHDLIVSLQGDESIPWVQAIQDGYVGAYRRAVDLGSTSPASLHVHLQRGNEQKILEFRLPLAPG